MSAAAEEEWISSVEASALARRTGELGIIEGRSRIIQRAQAGLVRARVKDVVKRVFKQSQAGPAPVANENGVVPIGTPLYIWDLPIEKERRSNVPLDEDDWLLSGLSEPDHPWWLSGDLKFQATNGSREGVDLFGIEFFRADIEKLRPADTTTGFAAPDVAPATPAMPAATAPLSKRRPRLPDGELRRSVSAYVADRVPLPDVKRIVWPAIEALHPNHSVARNRVVAMVGEILGAPLKPGPR